MATFNLGQVAIVNKGAWSSSVSYLPLNVVSHNFGSFMAIAANSNVQPGVTSGWASSWLSLSRGIASIDIVGEDSTHAHAVITLSDGTSVTGTTFSTSGVADNTISTAKLQNGAVTAPKLADGAVITAPMTVAAAKEAAEKLGAAAMLRVL